MSTISDPVEVRWNFGHPELTEAAEELFRAERCLIHGGIFEGNRATQRAAYPAVLSNYPPGSRQELAESEAVEHLKRSSAAMKRLHVVCPKCAQRWSHELFGHVMSAVIFCEMPHDGESLH